MSFNMFNTELWPAERLQTRRLAVTASDYMYYIYYIFSFWKIFTDDVLKLNVLLLKKNLIYTVNRIQILRQSVPVVFKEQSPTCGL